MENKLFSILWGFGKMRFRLRFYFILFVLSRLEFDTFLSARYFYVTPDRISQFLSQITCPELDSCVWDYNQTINVDEMNTTTPTATIIQQKVPNKYVSCLA